MGERGKTKGVGHGEREGGREELGEREGGREGLGGRGIGRPEGGTRSMRLQVGRPEEEKPAAGGGGEWNC